jgi:hypothetical protein
MNAFFSAATASRSPFSTALLRAAILPPYVNLAREMVAAEMAPSASATWGRTAAAPTAAICPNATRRSTPFRAVEER